MKKQILITIGREYGSGGHDLAALLSQRLGIRMLDRELIDELWKNDPEMQQLAQQYDERPANRILSRKINEFDNSIPHNVAQRQFDMIRQIADSGESAIFVGRCADYALAGRPGLLRIFCRRTWASGSAALSSGTICPRKRPPCWWLRQTGTAGSTITTIPGNSGVTVPAMT